jgi:cell wall-associated NlpC family hydrolase
MIKRKSWQQRGKSILKAATVFFTSVSLISMAQLSACAATTWSFWGDAEEESEYQAVYTKTVYKGQSGEFLDMEDTSGEITWSVDRPELLDISEDGELIPLKVGNAVVTVTVTPDSSEYVSEKNSASGEEAEVYEYYISICKKKAYKAIKKARAALGSAYSQEKRMEKGYYDCSSLIWRSYSPYGITFDETTWAPTAADQGLWCDENGKTIASKAVKVSSLKLVPGDLIFYAKDADNGRYKKIYHVAMFEGYQAELDEETGETTLSATMIDADGTSVVSRTYSTGNVNSGKSVVITARPTK